MEDNKNIYLEMLLTAKGNYYTKEKIIDITSLPPCFISEYAQFIIENISSSNNPFGIKNFNFFLKNSLSADAWARSFKNHHIICMHLGLFNILKKQTSNKFSLLKLPIIKVFSLTNKEEIHWIFYQFLTLFIYFHELAHLNQNKKAKGDTTEILKANDFACDASFNIMSHAKEIDADFFAAQKIVDGMLGYWDKVPADAKTKTNFEDFIALTSASIGLFFYAVRGGRLNEFYLLGHRHPHDIIRIAYITQSIVKITSEKVGDSQICPSIDKCSLKSMSYLNVLLSDENKSAPLTQYRDMYLENVNGIHYYMKEVMSPYSINLEWLIQNWDFDAI